MRQYIYKIIIAVIAIIVAFEFTIGKEISQINEKIDLFGSPEGRKNIIKSINIKLTSSKIRKAKFIKQFVNCNLRFAGL